MSRRSCQLSAKAKSFCGRSREVIHIYPDKLMNYDFLYSRSQAVLGNAILAKLSLASNSVPKYNLGTRKWRVGLAEGDNRGMLATVRDFAINGSLKTLKPWEKIHV
jgi:hypothetical protein